MKKIIRFIKCVSGFGTIKDNSICWFSKKFWNIHDYKEHKGGDGLPSHFYVYTCPNCHKLFTI